MSEKLCTLRTKGGGGKQTETVLWQNSAPTSNLPSSGYTQEVTLSDDMTNYDYIKVTFRASTTNSTSMSVLVSSSDIAAVVNGSNTVSVPAMATSLTSNWGSSRKFTFSAVNKINFYTSFKYNENGNSGAYLVPTSVIGIKTFGGKEQGSDWATVSVASTGTSNVCTGYAVASNSNKFTASYTNGSASGTITVLEAGLYDYAFTKANRGTGTASISIGGQSYYTGKGEIYIAANTVCTASVGGTAGSLGLACITLVKKS